MSPKGPRRPTARGSSPQSSGVARQDLQALLAQLGAPASRPGRSGTSSRSRRADDAERARLRAVLLKAIDDLEAADDLDGDDLDGEALDGEDLEGDDEYDDAGYDDAGYDEDLDEEDDEYGDGWGGWSSRRRFEGYRPARPIKVDGGLTTASRRGAIGSTWWSKRFLDAIEAAMVGGRLNRGRTYARQGQVLDLGVAPGLIEAKVQGSRKVPYRVRLAMPVVPDGDWDRIIGAMSAQAVYAARMLAGELPHEVEEVFAGEGASLFPGPLARLTTDCTCPDWANPCKHIAAVCYLVAESFDRDPFGVLAWRGRQKDDILAELRRRRSGTGEVEEGGPQAAGWAAPVVAVPRVEAPPLSDCILGFWKAGPELAQVRMHPAPAELPAAVLRHLPAGLLEVRGRDIGDILAPAYAAISTAAVRRALGDGGRGRQ